MSQNHNQNVSVNLSTIAFNLDVESMVGKVEELIGTDKTAAYEQYLELRASAAKIQKIASEYKSDADYFETLSEETYKKLIALDQTKALLPVAYALGTEQDIYDALRLHVQDEIAKQHPHFQKYASEHADGTSMHAYLLNTANDARVEATAMYKDADQVLRDAGMGKIVDDREAKRKLNSAKK
jgi:hypothetical protein